MLDHRPEKKVKSNTCSPAVNCRFCRCKKARSALWTDCGKYRCTPDSTQSTLSFWNNQMTNHVYMDPYSISIMKYLTWNITCPVALMNALPINVAKKKVWKGIKHLPHVNPAKSNKGFGIAAATRIPQNPNVCVPLYKYHCIRVDHGCWWSFLYGICSNWSKCMDSSSCWPASAALSS